MENNAQCQAACHTKSFICKLFCSAIPVFIFLVAAGYVVHHVWLMPIYQNTASLWRPMNEMKDMMPLVFAFYAVLSIAISAIFWKVQKLKMKIQRTPEEESQCKIGGKKCPVRFGVGFGGFIGILLGSMAASSYIWQPIPGELAVDWFVAWVVQGMCIGIILSLICHCKKMNCAAKP